MTRSASLRTSLPAQPTPDDALSVFPTELGWIGIVGTDERLIALTFGHKTPVGVRCELGRRLDLPDTIADSDWSPDLRHRLESFATGERVDFADVEIGLGQLSPFRQSVIASARMIDYGCTLTYGQLAEQAAFPGAARAVGQVMASNPIPLIVPCHRVVGAGGSLGGYSMRSGLPMKQRLLDMERTDRRTAIDGDVPSRQLQSDLVGGPFW